MRRIEEATWESGYDAVRGPGDFWWRYSDEGLELWVAVPTKHFVCDGELWLDDDTWRCEPHGFVTFDMSCWTIGHKNECGAEWSLSGDLDTPTLHPSLHAVGYWHGWVRQGKLVEAGWVDPDVRL